MIRNILVISAILLAATFTYAQTSDQTTEPTQQQMGQEQPSQNADMATIKHITGQVTKIDLKNKTITIKDDVAGVETQYTFNDTTTFNKDNETIKAEKVKKGQIVAIDVDSGNIITRFAIQPKSTTSTEKKSETPTP
jgi:predicted RNA-binding protein